MNIRIPSRIKRSVKILFAPLPRTHLLPAFSQDGALLKSLLQRVKANPTSDVAHRELGEYYAKRGAFIKAIAEFRTALAFAKTTATVHSLADAYRRGGYSALAEKTRAFLSAPSGAASTAELATVGSDDQLVLQSLNADVYQRVRATATRIGELYHGKTVRILDVGGGDGFLCLFLPEAEYVLVEPDVNGLTGDAALPERSFDVVVVCHVLEHIPAEARDGFLLDLCGKSRGHVLITGPFVSADHQALAEQLNQLAYDITKGSWAAEHIACKLPTTDSIKVFAERNGFPVTVTPTGNTAAVFWMMFAQHYAWQAGQGAELDRITQFFNAQMSNQTINSVHQVNDFIVELRVGEIV